MRDEALADDLRNLTVDAAPASFVDCTFLGVLVALARECAARNVRFRIADPSPVVVRLCDLLGLVDVLGADRHDATAR